MIQLDLKGLVVPAEKQGWAEANGDLEAVRRQAYSLGWKEVPVRRGDPATTVLRPTPKEEAQPRSLSAQYGLDAQPLHTDGAHLADPPDFVVLFAEQPNETPTRLFRPTMMNRQHMPPSEELRHGMFVVRNGRDSFFAPAYDLRRYRFDRGCMTPCDTRAHTAEEFFAAAEGRTVAHQWAAPHQILIIDNRSTLHARDAVPAGDHDRTLVRVAYRIGGTR